MNDEISEGRPHSRAGVYVAGARTSPKDVWFRIFHTLESGNPYVDGPRLARAWQLEWVWSVAVICPAPRFFREGRLLWCGRMTAGPDGLRGSGPKQGRDV